MFKRLHEAQALSNNSLIPVSRTQKTYLNINSLWRSKSITEAIGLFKADFTETDRLIIKFMLKLFRSCKYVAMNQQTIAEETGTSRRSVQRCLDRLYEHDILRRYFPHKKHINKNETNHYYINEYFTQEIIAYPLRCFFSNVTVILFTLASLYPNPTSSFPSGALLNLNDSVLIKPTVRDSISTGMESIGEVFITKKRKEIKVNKETITLLSNNLDKLPLTERGIMKLSHFTPEVISQVLKQRLNLNVVDLFAYIWSIAKAKALPLNSDDFDHSLYNKTCKVLGIEHKPYIDSDLFQQLQQREMMMQPYKPKIMSHNYKATTSSTQAVINPTPYPTLDTFVDKMKKKAIAQNVYVEGMSFGDMQEALRKNYTNTILT